MNDVAEKIYNIRMKEGEQDLVLLLGAMRDFVNVATALKELGAVAGLDDIIDNMDVDALTDDVCDDIRWHGVDEWGDSLDLQVDDIYPGAEKLAKEVQGLISKYWEVK